MNMNKKLELPRRLLQGLKNLGSAFENLSIEWDAEQREINVDAPNGPVGLIQVESEPAETIVGYTRRKIYRVFIFDYDPGDRDTPPAWNETFVAKRLHLFDAVRALFLAIVAGEIDSLGSVIAEQMEEVG